MHIRIQIIKLAIIFYFQSKKEKKKYLYFSSTKLKFSQLMQKKKLTFSQYLVHPPKNCFKSPNLFRNYYI